MRKIVQESIVQTQVGPLRLVEVEPKQRGIYKRLVGVTTFCLGATPHAEHHECYLEFGCRENVRMATVALPPHDGTGSIGFAS